MNKSKRGGDHNTGRVMSFNTSGLAAIGFFVSEAGTRCVRVSYGDKRNEFSTAKHGVSPALQKAIERRVKAGLPAPSLRRARRAFDQFDWKAAAKAAGVRLVQR